MKVGFGGHLVPSPHYRGENTQVKKSEATHVRSLGVNARVWAQILVPSLSPQYSFHWTIGPLVGHLQSPLTNYPLTPTQIHFPPTHEKAEVPQTSHALCYLCVLTHAVPSTLETLPLCSSQ